MRKLEPLECAECATLHGHPSTWHCQLFVGSLTRQHRTTPPATRPRPQPSDPLASKPGTARAHRFLQRTLGMHMCMHACLQKAVGSSGAGLRGQWV